MSEGIQMSHNLIKHEFMFKEIVIHSLKHHYMSHCPKVILQPTADWNEMWKVHNAIEQGTERLSHSTCLGRMKKIQSC